jgi:serine/threonine protein kinase
VTATVDVRDVLAEIAMEPLDQWKQLLEARFRDQPALVQQGLLWLRANREQPEIEPVVPSLGKLGDDRYELVLRLAAGATSDVWRARDRKLGRDVAIKLFHGSGDGASTELREARAACDMISDHVVRVLDVHDAQVRPYIVMELVAEHDVVSGELAMGSSSASCRPRDVREAARWVMDVARGVRDAHLRNVFHRDLKPHNVLITPISRRARVADFGLALSAAAGEFGRSSSQLVKRGPTGPVSIAGTPEYMAPEQARGLPIDLDPLDVTDRMTLVEIDVWGLGALAYDFLAGRPPWLAAHHDEPWEIAASGARPAALDRTPSGERIPPPLRRIVDKALAAAPNDRYSSAGQLVTEFEAFLGHRPTSLDRSNARRAWLWAQRNPQLTMTGLIAVILAAITLISYAAIIHLRDQRHALTAELQKDTSEEAQVKARNAQIRGELATTESQLTADQARLAELETSLRDEQKVYAALLAAKEKALEDANAATRALVGELGAARAEQRTAEQDATKYQQVSESERAAADDATRARDRAQTDRDGARTERDQLKQERDAAASERDQARGERDQGAQEIARLTTALAAARHALDSRGDVGGSGSAVVNPVVGSGRPASP